MQCANCKAELPPNAKFCPQCGTAVPARAGIQVQQDIGTVKGSATGAVLGKASPPAGLDVSTSQKVDAVESGGAVAGAVVGGSAPVHVGGQQHYGDAVQGDKHVTKQSGGVHIEGSAHIGGDVVGGDKVTSTINVGDATRRAAAYEIAQLFAGIYQQIAVRPADPNVEKEELIQTVQRIEKENTKGERANPGKVEGLLKTLLSTAPDIGKFVIAALTSPAGGIATALRKAAEKAKAEI